MMLGRRRSSESTEKYMLNGWHDELLIVDVVIAGAFLWPGRGRPQCMNLSRSQELKKQIWMNSRGADGWVTKYEEELARL